MANTLKKVKIEANSMNSVVGHLEPMRSVALATYPLVSEVWFVQTTRYSNFFSAYAETCQLFPNTQDLRVDYGTSTIHEPFSPGVTYRYIANLPKLRRAILPWPINGLGSSPEPTILAQDLQVFLLESRFRLLEYIDFVSAQCFSAIGMVCRVKPTRPQPTGFLTQQRFYTWGDSGF
ncbi:hypothetical protein TWF718_002804 [Orbilia javanica]|uniref:Uncharacterized protein n=1 Tax=Orbilia javanica TaxID=47235 RepID=A0AAN8MEV4_9PEZI